MLKINIHNQLLRIAFLTAIVGFIIPAIGMMSLSRKTGGVNRIVIDAGHGGHDSGNLGTGRYKDKEKHISLEVAMMFGNYVKQNMPGVEVIYTRSTDEFIGLKERAALANRKDADLFISIHCNAHTGGSAYGTETFVMGLTREKANLDLARTENSVIFLEDDYENKYEGYNPNDPQGAILARYTSNAYLDQSARFAQKIQDQFRDRVNRFDRGVKQSVLYVLDFSAMPSVLIELGFLTNKTEEDFLNTQNGKELMASAIYRAFKDYKTEQDELDNVDAEVVVPIKTPVTKEPVPTKETPKKETKPTEKPVETTPVTTKPTPSQTNEKPVFKIQLSVSDKKITLEPQNFKGLSNVGFYQEDKLYKYTYGEFGTLDEANKALPLVRAKGYKDAFVIAFYKGERIAANKAAQIQP